MDGTASRGRAQLDKLLVVLADGHRRQVLRYFQRGNEDVASVETLIGYVIKEGEGTHTYTQLEQEFHHILLPKLVDCGLVEYDERSRTVRYDGNPQLERILTVLDDAER